MLITNINFNVMRWLIWLFLKFIAHCLFPPDPWNSTTNAMHLNYMHLAPLLILLFMNQCHLNLTNKGMLHLTICLLIPCFKKYVFFLWILILLPEIWCVLFWFMFVVDSLQFSKFGSIFVILKQNMNWGFLSPISAN